MSKKITTYWEQTNEVVECDECRRVIFNKEYVNRPGHMGGEMQFCLPCYRKSEAPESLDHIQERLHKWNLRNFSEEYPEHRLVVALKYLGDLTWIHMKSARNMWRFKDDSEVIMEKRSLIGDVALALITFATDNGLNFFEILEKRFLEVEKLDFTRWPINGKDK